MAMPMTVDHTHTAQEQTIWDHMEAGEWDAIDQMREDAQEADQSPPETPPPPGWRPPIAQYQIDHKNAHAHYQDAHEPPESERMANTVAHVGEENAAAGG
jgi:hypothetical protein